MIKFIEEFKTFAIRGNVLDMAVGVIIGGAFTSIVNSLVTDVFTPVIGKLTGGIDFSAIAINLGGDSKIMIGNFLNAVISFVIVAFCVFLLVKAINKFTKKKEAEAPAPAPSADVVLLTEIRDILKEKH